MSSSVSISDPSSVSLIDPPMWPDLDIFDWSAMSSPPWTAPSDNVHFAPVFPIPPTHHISTNLGPVIALPPSATKDDRPHCLARTIEAHPRPQSTPPCIVPGKPEPVLSHANLKPVTHAPFPDPLPHADSIIDSAFDFPSPSSPVLSDPPDTCNHHSVFHHPIVTLTQHSPVQMPFSSQNATAHELNTLPALHSHALSTGPAITSASCMAESVSSQGSSLPSQMFANQSLQGVNEELTSQTVSTRNRVMQGGVGKQLRRYSAPKSSRYCHLCARHQRCVEMVPCSNIELGLCQKSVCRKCIKLYELQVDGPSWSCPHCQNKCPKRAKCFAYDRQTARRREKTLKAKMSLLSLGNKCKKAISKQ